MSAVTSTEEKVMIALPGLPRTNRIILKQIQKQLIQTQNYVDHDNLLESQKSFSLIKADILAIQEEIKTTFLRFSQEILEKKIFFLKGTEVFCLHCQSINSLSGLGFVHTRHRNYHDNSSWRRREFSQCRLLCPHCLTQTVIADLEDFKTFSAIMHTCRIVSDSELVSDDQIFTYDIFAEVYDDDRHRLIRIPKP